MTLEQRAESAHLVQAGPLGWSVANSAHQERHRLLTEAALESAGQIGVRHIEHSANERAQVVYGGAFPRQAAGGAVPPAGHRLRREEDLQLVAGRAVAADDRVVKHDCTGLADVEVVKSEGAFCVMRRREKVGARERRTQSINALQKSELGPRLKAAAAASRSRAKHSCVVRMTSRPEAARSAREVFRELPELLLLLGELEVTGETNLVCCMRRDSWELGVDKRDALPATGRLFSASFLRKCVDLRPETDSERERE